MKAGAVDFIEKPLREDALLESIERAQHWNDRGYEERLEHATLFSVATGVSDGTRTSTSGLADMRRSVTLIAEMIELLKLAALAQRL
jgi:FixJ family two-component response regulator